MRKNIFQIKPEFLVVICLKLCKFLSKFKKECEKLHQDLESFWNKWFQQFGSATTTWVYCSQCLKYFYAFLIVCYRFNRLSLLSIFIQIWHLKNKIFKFRNWKSRLIKILRKDLKTKYDKRIRSNSNVELFWFLGKFPINFTIY